MKILTTFTYEYLDVFKECFLPSLPQDTDLRFQYHNYSLTECEGKFGSHDTLYKIPFILKTLESCKEGEKIFYCDIDIVILNDKIEEIINSLPEADIHIQWDNPDGGVCLGCMVLTNNENTRNLLRNFLEKDVDWILKNYGISLNYFQYLLTVTPMLNWKILPLEFYGGQMKKHRINVKEMHLYHATFEPNISAKHKTLSNYLKNKNINKLKFLILLTYYNRPELVKNALESIKRLKYENWELAIVDDGSDALIEDNFSINKDKLKYIRIPDNIEIKNQQGGSRHGQFLNQVIAESDADIIIPLCDDDALMDDYLSKLNIYFQEHPEISYCYSNAFTFDPIKECPFDITQRRTDFGYHTEPTVPHGILDASQVVFRSKCFKKDGLKYPYPQTKDLDAVVFKQAYEIYGPCHYTGFYGQYKAIFPGQLGFRKNTYNYIDSERK